MKKVLSKLLTLFVWMRYPNIPSQQRFFIRYRYLGILHQLKFFVKDYIIKKPYKIIEFKGEFQQELMHAIPHAYWHHNNGTLLKTISSSFSKEMYFFSENHVEKNDLLRSHEENYNSDIPNAPHDTSLLKLKWKQVPYRKVFGKTEITFEKKPIVIANRFNTEWERDPISYFDLNDLEELIKNLSEDFQIIYNRPLKDHISHDNSEILELGDTEWLKNHYPNVLIMTEMYKESKMANNYNHFQLLIYSKVEHFISIHGGTAVLASLFGGRNFIYSKEGHEHALSEFQNVFPELSNCKIDVFREKTELFNSLHRMRDDLRE